MTKRTSRPNRFYSRKNRTELFYNTRAELLIILLLEFDQKASCYRPFEYRMVNSRTLKEMDISSGFAVNRGTMREYIILSDCLAADPKLAAGVKQVMQRSEPNPITLTIYRPCDIEDNSKAKSLELLYNGGNR
jgi:hypothetical protein